MSNELKACPFCGEMPEVLENIVRCKNMLCAIYGSVTDYDCWNLRPTEAKTKIAEKTAELACAELDKEYAYKIFSHYKAHKEPVEKQCTALEYFQREARLICDEVKK